MVDKKFIGLDKPDITRFESYLPTAFSSELTLLQKVNKIIQDLNRSFDLSNEMVEYLNHFVETFDEKLYGTVEDILNAWETNGELEALLNKYYLNRIEPLLQRLTNEWESWVESNKEIIENIDPTGMLLTEIIEARGIFARLDDRATYIETRLSNPLTTDKIKGSSIQLSYPENETGLDVQTLMRKLKNANVNTVSLCPRFWANNKLSEITGFHNSDVLTYDYIRNFCLVAKSEGLQVMLKPHITGDNFTSYNSIQPLDSVKFIKSYSSNLIDLFEYTKDCVDIVSITNEMDTQTKLHRDLWVQLISSIRVKKPSIKITNASRIDDLFTNVFLDKLDFLGVNIYAGIGGNLLTPIAQQKRDLFTLTNSLNRMIESTRKYDKPILITEVGCQPYETALANPESWTHEGTINYDYQKRYYDVVLRQLFNSSQTNGTVIWQSAGQSTGGGFGWVGTGSENTVKEIYGGH